MFHTVDGVSHAAISTDGSVRTWGFDRYVGDSSAAQHELQHVVAYPLHRELGRVPCLRATRASLL